VPAVAVYFGQHLDAYRPNFEIYSLICLLDLILSPLSIECLNQFGLVVEIPDGMDIRVRDFAMMQRSAGRNNDSILNLHGVDIAGRSVLPVLINHYRSPTFS
jgi:hypothetical protein